MGREMKKFTKPHEKRLYKIYYGIKTRCLNPHCDNFDRYGGRGITICDEWLTSFDNFYNWAIANGYEDHLTIDRLDNDGNYCPNNCAWHTHRQQMKNTSRNIYVDFGGEKTALTTISEALNIPDYVLRERRNAGDTGEKLFRPCLRRSRKVMCIETGKIFESITDAERSLGLKHGGIWQQIKGNNKTCGGFTWRYAEK